MATPRGRGSWEAGGRASHSSCGDPARARELAGGLFGFTIAAVAALLLVGAPVLVDLLAPDYRGPVRDLTVLLLRVHVPALLFLTGTTVGMAFLESERRFGVTISAQKVVPGAVVLALLLVVADRFGIVAVARSASARFLEERGDGELLPGAPSALRSLEGRRGASRASPRAWRSRSGTAAQCPWASSTSWPPGGRGWYGAAWASTRAVS